MSIMNLKEFIKRTGISRSSIYRWYDKHPKLKAETIMKKRRVFPESHIKYHNNELLFNENQKLEKEIVQMKRLLDCLSNGDSIEKTMYKLPWTHFVTVAYKNDRNKKSCFAKMTGFYNSCREKYGENPTIKMFFTTEPFTNRNGYHNHFLLNVQNIDDFEVREDIENFFKYDRVEIAPYDKYKAGIYYITKGGLKGEDWDFI